MRILFICHRLPHPPNRGGKIRPYHMIRHLSGRHRVTVASLAASDEELREGEGLLRLGVEVIAELLPPATRWRHAVAALPTTTPSSAAYFWSPALRRRILDAAGTGFDVVMVHCAFVGPYAARVPARLRIMDFGDLDSAKWGSYARQRRLPLSLGYALEARKLRRLEARLASTFDRITVTTPGEGTTFATLGVNRPCRVIPNGVDTSYFQPRLDPGPAARTLVFLGRMDYFPNVDGIGWFVREVLPLVRRRAPDVELRIVGSSPVSAVRRLARDRGVTVTGSVPDVRPYMHDAALSIAPLRIARGTQNKILESMAMGLPVVATSAAAGGIQAQRGRHLLAADDPSAFADSVVALLQDQARRRDLVTAARRDVLAAHAWPASMQLLDDLIADV
jgi:sugar transferase (PEP-CTERM/EpsH1 system associated)